MHLLLAPVIAQKEKKLWLVAIKTHWSITTSLSHIFLTDLSEKEKTDRKDKMGHTHSP